ncbi:hypothetical protein KIN20_014352 [Parelaphostrongylus tenuis]|uniref:Protein kinase C-terminal domain-containing protein n=1 Tax=Parelaphostrongylus tenuis TaxID=148309 RepID=A0AAD5MH16_PARTN|nr:hypothetical protein KIN20_014352 [Parelaphostrongylus tenuis]
MFVACERRSGFVDFVNESSGLFSEVDTVVGGPFRGPSSIPPVYLKRFTTPERPAPIRIEVKSIDDTSNFDDFPDVDLRWPTLTVPEKPEEQPGHRGEFVDFTYKRFDGHTQKMRYSEMQKQSRGVGSPGEGTQTVV